MKKIGIVGGIAWPSTVEYYVGLCRLSERQGDTPEMAIESLDHNRAVAYVGDDAVADSWLRFDAYHRDALKRLEAAGADFAVIASNTSHHRLAEIASGLGIPVLSIIDAAARECVRLDAKEVLILGTATTMRSSRFRAAFAARGIVAAGPEDPKVRAACVELSHELQHKGEVPGAATRLGQMVRASRGGQAPLVCLACTELPLAFPEQKTLTLLESGGLRYMNTTAVHIRAAFDYANAA